MTAMSEEAHPLGVTAPNASSTDPESLSRLFGFEDDLLPLWIAEPYLPLADEIRAGLEDRAAAGWYGYERRSRHASEMFQSWMDTRHGWNSSEATMLVSPSVGTSIGLLIEAMTSPDDGVILQPPVFTDFKSLIVSAGRSVVRNPLTLTNGTYSMDLDDLAEEVSDPRNRLLILCNPHNPVGRVWTIDELEAVATLCSDNGVYVVADEIHADLILSGSRFQPFAIAAEGTSVKWAATHGPIKTFGLAGVCDSLLVTNSEETAASFGQRISQLHLARNNVFGMSAFEIAYERGGAWLDGLLADISTNLSILRDGLPDGIDLIEPEGTYLAWLDMRDLGMDVPALAVWLAQSAKLALSPGHWFGREGAGFARMTIATPQSHIEDAVDRLRRAIG